MPYLNLPNVKEYLVQTVDATLELELDNISSTETSLEREYWNFFNDSLKV